MKTSEVPIEAKVELLNYIHCEEFYIPEEDSSMYEEGIESINDEFDHLVTNVDKIYRHYKGGYYRTLMEGKETDNAESVVIYEHLYPNEIGIWVRKKDEFFSEGRFDKIEV